MQVAKELITAGRYRHGLFFVHLALEKITKAHICQNTRDLAPKIHNLNRLAEIASLSLSEAQLDILAELNVYNLKGRYPDSILSSPSHDETENSLHQAEELFIWLMTQLSE